MGQKTISLTEPVYKKLQKRKPKSLSYSQFLDKLLDEKKPKQIHEITPFCGCLNDSKDDEWDNILSGIYENRKKVSTRKISLDD